MWGALGAGGLDSLYDIHIGWCVPFAQYEEVTIWFVNAIFSDGAPELAGI